MNKVKILTILVLSLIVSVAYANNSKSLVPILSFLLFDENNVASIEFSASSASEWEGYEVELSARLVDKNGEYSPISKINCDAGTLIDSTLTLPRVEQDTNISCSAIAVDSQGRDLSESLNIEVKAISLMASEFQANYAVGRGMIFDYRGPVSAAISENARLDIQGQSIEVTLFKNQIIAFLPNEYQGTQGFELVIGEHSQAFSIFIEAAPIIAAPRDYLTQYIDDLISFINLSENPEFQSLFDDLQTLKASIPNRSEQEVQDLALYMEQNYESLDLLQSDFFAAKQISSFNCAPAPTFVAGVIIAGAAIGVTAVSAKAGQLPATLLGLAAVFVGAKIAKRNAEAVVAECVGTVIARIAQFFVKEKRFTLSKQISSNTELLNAEVGEIRIELQNQIPDSVVRNEFISYLDRYRGLLIELSSLSGGLLDSVVASLPTTDQSSDFAQSEQVFIKSIGDSNVMSTLSQGEGDKLNVVFEFIDLAQVPVETASSTFEVVLGIVDSEIEIPITVKLSVDVAPNLDFSVDDEIIEDGSTGLTTDSERDFVLFKVKNNGFLPFVLDSIVSENNNFIIETLFSNAIQPNGFEHFRVRYIGDEAAMESTTVALSSSEVNGYAFSFDVAYNGLGNCASNRYQLEISSFGYDNFFHERGAQGLNFEPLITGETYSLVKFKLYMLALKRNGTNVNIDTFFPNDVGQGQLGPNFVNQYGRGAPSKEFGAFTFTPFGPRGSDFPLEDENFGEYIFSVHDTTNDCRVEVPINLIFDNRANRELHGKEWLVTNTRTFTTPLEVRVYSSVMRFDMLEDHDLSYSRFWGLDFVDYCNGGQIFRNYGPTYAKRKTIPDPYDPDSPVVRGEVLDGWINLTEGGPKHRYSCDLSRRSEFSIQPH